MQKMQTQITYILEKRIGYRGESYGGEKEEGGAYL